MTAVPSWQPGTLYQPDSLVVPSNPTSLVDGTLTNGDFEAGDTGWIHQLDAAHQWRIDNTNPPFSPFQGTWCANFGQNISTTGVYQLVNTKIVKCTPGQVISLKAMIANATGPANAGASVAVFFWDASSSGGYGSPGAVQVGFQSGDSINGSTSYQLSAYTAVAPAGAAYAQFAVNAYSNSYPCDIQCDACSWDYAGITPPTGLVFQATQTGAATSGTTEPTWPTVLGGTVTDGGVTWTAVQDTQVTWTASPILVSAGSEPTWPTDIGAVVADGTIGWTAISSRITDSKCPNTETVAIAASKIFAGDKDIIDFSATVNPLDWTTANDAGYLPFGLQTYGAEPVAAIGLYKSNLVAFNASAFQMWQIDQDPANMAILDAVPVGCRFPRSLQPVMNDLLFLSPVGFRNVSIVGTGVNLQANGIGQPIDSMVKPYLKSLTVDPFSLFYPTNGQYWGIFGSDAFVLTVTGEGTGMKSWSRYTFPSAIDDWTVLDGDLILRSGTKVWRVSYDALWDDIVNPIVDITIGSGSDILVAAPYGDSGLGYRQGQGGSLTPDTIPVGTILQVDNGASGTLYFAVAADLPQNGIPTFTIPDSDAGPLTFDPASAVLYIPYDGEKTAWYFDVTGHIFTDGSTYTLTFYPYKGYDAAVGIGSVASTTLSGYTLLRAAINGTTGDFELQLSDVLDADTAFNSILLYLDSVLTSTLDIGDATITTVGSITIGATTYNNVVQYSWPSTTTFLDAASTINVELDNFVAPASKVDFTGTVWWPHMDCGPMGPEKQLIGMDLIADAPTGVTVSIGYDQRDVTARTSEYAMDADTLPGPIVPFPLSAPSFDVRLTFAAGQAWEQIAANLYLK